MHDIERLTLVLVVAAAVALRSAAKSLGTFVNVLTRSKLERPLLVPGEFGAITSGMQHAHNSSSELNLLRYN